MAYTNVWTDTLPNGTEAANTIANIFRSVKVDLEQRLGDIFSLPVNDSAHFAIDPLRLYGLKFTDAQDSIISLGDNAGTPRNIIYKNKTGATAYLTFGATPSASVAFNFFAGLTSTTVAATGLISGSAGLTISAGSTSLQALTATTGNFSAINVDSGGTVTESFNISTVSKALIGVAGVAGQVINTSQVGDLVIRSNGFNILFSVDSGATSKVVISSAGLVTLSNGLTVSAGTSSLQALTAITITASSSINGQSFSTISSVAGYTFSDRTTQAQTFTWFSDNSNAQLYSTSFGPTVAVGFSSGVWVFSKGITASSGTTSLQALTATTGNFTSGLTTVSETISNSVAATLIVVSTTGNDSYIQLKGLGTTVNWRIGKDITTSGAFELQASNTVGGTDWASKFILNNAGALTLSGGLTVSSGSSSFQAITATSATFSSTITQANNQGFFVKNLAGTPGILVLGSADGSVYLGDFSNVYTNTKLISNGAIVVTYNSTSFVSTVTITAVGLLSSSGLTVSSGSSSLQALTATSITATSGTLIPNGQFYSATRNTGGANIGVLGFDGGTDILRLRTGGSTFTIRDTSNVDQLSMSAAGNFSFNVGITVSTSTSNFVGIASSGGLSVSAGSSSVQALTTTSITATGIIRNDSATGGYAVGNLGGVQRIQWDGLSSFGFLTAASTDANIVGAKITLSNGITVSSGTSALQALTATTGNFSGLVTGAKFNTFGGSIVCNNGASVNLVLLTVAGTYLFTAYITHGITAVTKCLITYDGVVAGATTFGISDNATWGLSIGCAAGTHQVSATQSSGNASETIIWSAILLSN